MGSSTTQYPSPPDKKEEDPPLDAGPHAGGSRRTDGDAGLLGKRRRACEWCRGSKAKCIFEDDSPNLCKNCAKAKRICVIEHDMRYPTHPGEKRSRRETGHASNSMSPASSKTKENEVSKNENAIGEAFPFLSHGDKTAENDKMSAANAKRSIERASLTPSGPDVIDRKFISVNVAQKCFTYFLDHQSKRLPWIGFPTPPSFNLCRQQTPFLFLAICAAGAGHDSSDLQARLMDEFWREMADLVISRSQKRTDIVHAILIATLWAPPPERLEELRYSTNAHLSASMIADLTQVGPFESAISQMGRTSSAKSSHMPQRVMKESEKNSNGTAIVEGWRVLISSYCTCSTFALLMSRQSQMRYNSRLERAINLLSSGSSSGDSESRATEQDRTILKWTKLHRIEEDVAEAKESMPTDGNELNRTIMTGLLSTSFDTRLLEWRQSLDKKDEENEMLLVAYNFVHLQSAVLALSDQTQLTPYRATSENLTANGSSSNILTVAKSVRAAKTILEIFLSIPPADFPSLPSIIIPRILYSVISLVKATSAMADMHRNVEEFNGCPLDLTQVLKTEVKPSKSAKPGFLEDVKSMRVVEYCDQLTQFFQSSAGPRPGRVGKIISLMAVLKGWYIKNILLPAEEQAREQGKERDVASAAGAAPSMVRAPTVVGAKPFVPATPILPPPVTTSLSNPAWKHSPQLNNSFSTAGGTASSFPKYNIAADRSRSEGVAILPPITQAQTPTAFHTPGGTSFPTAASSPMGLGMGKGTSSGLGLGAGVGIPMPREMEILLNNAPQSGYYAGTTPSSGNSNPTSGTQGGYGMDAYPGYELGNQGQAFQGGQGDSEMTGMEMDGIPVLNPYEESQYGFLDALLGPGGGAVPFGMVGDAMAEWGWA